MKVSPGFKQQIQKYLNERAKTDILFGPAYDKEHKNIDDCITYILGEVKKKAGTDNAIAMTDEEVYSLAVHYYDEDNIVVGNSNIKSFTKVSKSPIINDENDDIQEEIKSNLTLTDKRKLNNIIDDDIISESLFD